MLITLYEIQCFTGHETGRRVSVWSEPTVDSSRTAADGNATDKRNTEGRRLQLRYNPAGDNIQSDAVLHRPRSAAVYV